MTREHLAETARREAARPYNGAVCGLEPNLGPMIDLFPGGSLEELDGRWCAAFVYYCCTLAGFSIPPRPEDCSASLAACSAWEELALADNRVGLRSGGCVPTPGDIVLFDGVFEGKPHDHIAIVLEDRGGSILTAEGNTGNISAIVERPKDRRIRCYISLPDGYSYTEDNRGPRPSRRVSMPEPIVPLAPEQAQELASWKYPDEYALYNWPEGEPVDSLLGGDVYGVVNSAGELIGFYQIGEEARIPFKGRSPYAAKYTDIGLGLRPDLCGLGFGRAFVLSGMRFAAERLEAQRFRLTVAAFNKRAIKVYESCGFKEAKKVTHKITGEAYITMVKDKEK